MSCQTNERSILATSSSGCGNMTSEFIKPGKKKSQSGTCCFFPHSPKSPSCQAEMMKDPKKYILLISNYLSVSHDTKIFT